MCTYVMNKVMGVRLVKCPFKFKLCSYSEKVIIFLSSLAFLFAWMKLWISSFRSRIHTSSLSLPYTPPTPTYFFSSHTNIFFLLPHQHILSSGFNEMENPMMCTGIKSVQTHKNEIHSNGVDLVRFPNPLAFGLPKVRRGPCLGRPPVALSPI